jgi:hypothetical protein
LKHSSPPRSNRLFVIAGVAVCALLAWVVHRARQPDAPPVASAEEASAEPAPSVPPPPAPPQRRPPAPAAPAPSEEIITSDGLPIMPVRGEPTGPVHPHPITPRHLRIYAENRLIGGIEGAMEVKDTAGMRRLLEQYRREYPEDDNQLQDGYAVIADCLDHRDDATRAAAERWLDLHNGSGAKRFVLRHCIEPVIQTGP